MKKDYCFPPPFFLTDVLRELALQKESNILEGSPVGDCIQMLVSIPPKYALWQVKGYIKGKRAIHIARTTNASPQQNFTGKSFWARGYYISTSARDEETIRPCIQKQEQLDNKIDQMSMFK